MLVNVDLSLFLLVCHCSTNLTDVLHLLLLPRSLTQVRLQHPSKSLQQYLEADLGDGWIVPSLAQLVPDERMLRPRELVEAECHSGFSELGADQITTGVGHVCILDAKDQGYFAVLELLELVDGVRSNETGRGCRVRARSGSGRGGIGTIVGAEGARVDVGAEVGNGGGYTRVELAKQG